MRKYGACRRFRGSGTALAVHVLAIVDIDDYEDAVDSPIQHAKTTDTETPRHWMNVNKLFEIRIGGVPGSERLQGGNDGRTIEFTDLLQRTHRTGFVSQFHTRRRLALSERRIK